MAVTNPPATAGNHCITVHTGNGHGSINTCIRRYTTTLTSVGTAVTYADSATLGASFTIVLPGIYEIYIQEALGVSQGAGASLNSTQLTTSVLSIAIADRIAATWDQGGAYQCATRTMRLVAGDVVRPHTDGSVSGTSNISFFSIRRVGQ